MDRIETASELLPEACQLFIQHQLEGKDIFDNDEHSGLVDQTRHHHDEAQNILRTDKGIDGMVDYLKANGMADVASMIIESIEEQESFEAIPIKEPTEPKPPDEKAKQLDLF